MAKFSKEEKMKRRLLLMEQHELQSNYCFECPIVKKKISDLEEEANKGIKKGEKPKKKDLGSISPDKICGGCEIYDRLRFIGDSMLETVNNEDKFRPKQKQRSITLEIYNEMSAAGKTDREIREHFDIAKGSWYGIKKKLGAKMKDKTSRNYKGVTK